MRRIQPSVVFLASLFSWLLGVGWPSLNYNQGVLSLLLLLFWILQRFSLLVVLLLIITSYLLGSSSYARYLERHRPATAPVSVENLQLTILEPPLRQESRATYRARANSEWYVDLVLNNAPLIEPATTVTVSGEIKPLGDEYSEAWLAGAKSHLYAKIVSPTIISQLPAVISPAERLLVASRKIFRWSVEQLFTQPQAGLFSSILTGDKSSLDNLILTDFTTSGLSHLIAVSGFNVTILLSLCQRWTQLLSRSLQTIVLLTIIIFFVLFTGSSASVVRAGLFASFSVIGRLLGRQLNMGRLIALTAVIMTIVNPLYLRYDIGFQLSFAALVGLSLFGNFFTSRLTDIHLPPWLAEVAGQTMAANLTTWPLIAYRFNSFSLYSFAANLIIGPIIPFLTIAGFPLLLCSINKSLAEFISLPFELILRLTINTVHWFATLPKASLAVADQPYLLWLVYYTIILLFYFKTSEVQDT